MTAPLPRLVPTIILLAGCGTPPEIVGIDNPVIPVASVAGGSKQRVFIASNEYILPHDAKEIEAFTDAGGEKEIVEAIPGLKPSSLNAAFDEMEKSFRTIEDYFAAGLGIDADGQQALRSFFLQDG